MDGKRNEKKQAYNRADEDEQKPVLRAMHGVSFLK
jgi:hypothetical protein